MPRTFDGANDNIHCAVGACGLTGAFTLVAVVRRNSNTNYHNLLTVHTSGGTSTFGLELESSGDGNGLQVQVGAGFVAGSFTVLAADGWVLVAGGKVAGVAAPRLHKLVYSTGTWTHADGTNMFGGNPASAAGGTVRFGEWEGGDDLDGDIAAAAIFDRNLTDAEVEQLAHSLQGWFAAAPVGMWLFDQQATGQAVADLTGNGANQSSIAGTSVATSSLPGLSYGHEILIPHSVPAAGGGSTVTGTATGLFGFTAPASGKRTVKSTATGAFGFTAPAAGRKTVRATATGAFGFTAPAAGKRTVRATATGVFGFTAPAMGKRTVTGTAAAAFGFTAPATGARTVHGTATGQFGFTAPAVGEGSSQPPVTGSATALFGFTAAATGRRTVRGTATALFGFAATAAGKRSVSGVAAAAFGFLASAAGGVPDATPLTPDVTVDLAAPVRAVDLAVPVAAVDLAAPVRTVAL